MGVEGGRMLCIDDGSDKLMSQQRDEEGIDYINYMGLIGRKKRRKRGLYSRKRKKKEIEKKKKKKKRKRNYYKKTLHHL